MSNEELTVQIMDLEKRLSDLEEALTQNVQADIKLAEQVEKLMEHVEHLITFCNNQVQINNILRFLVREKYTQKELEDATKRYEEAQKRLHSDDEKDENLHKNEEDQKK